MSKTNKSLSDLLDDQCSSADLDSLLNDQYVSESWHRYNAVSAILKEEYSVNANIDFCKKISAKIADEPAILAAPRPQQIKNKPFIAEIRKISSGFAIAASVAFATFFSVQTLQVSSDLSPSNKNSVEVNQSNSESVAVEKTSMPISNDSLEQLELESFNDILMLQARKSEQESIAPFATSVGGEYVKTIRISAEQWQQIVRKAALRQAKIDAAKSSKSETDPVVNEDLESDGE